MFRKKFRGLLTPFRNCLCIFTFILLLFVYNVKKSHKEEVLAKIPKSATKYISFKEHQKPNPLHIETIKRAIAKYNAEERIKNLDYFGPMKSDAPIFVIFVDNYMIHLKYLLVSLVQVVGIDDALIIFSHSSFDENVNNLIKQIDFTRVLQIFYPYSVQMSPNEFPGFNAGDCPHDMDINTAYSINCTGADSPDIHGQYRHPLHAQLKHYWWWTLNKVFENLSYTKDHKGIFTFLESDVYLAEDFIYMNSHMKTLSNYVTKCEFLSLENPSFTNFFEKQTYVVDITTWDPKDHSSVLSFDSSVWSTIASHYYHFCSIDDYSWSRSLYYLSLNRKDGGRFKVISSSVPRAFKTNSMTGVYQDIEELNILDVIHNVMYMQERNKGYSFPPFLEVYLNIELEDDDFVIFDYVDNNGGWSDPRDKNMCNNMTSNKIKKVIMDMNHEFHQYDLNP
ncbi:unnamed protein product [Chrysodeixis includens]|uniref:Alpha-1,6-mannosyl-glycoprotein 2-beta-N-acetylglucosaminyltransferase n=1 Tax=Chrysodeixis includens TaxID=689277 RepID=A0A9P0C079_CHRIL|nr:unnamed protein product [Chrysodeixis includens]